VGLARYEKKIALAKMNIRSLTDDLNRVTTPSLRIFILSQIAQKHSQILYLGGKISADAGTKAPPVQPLPKKKTSAPRATTITTKKKALDKHDRVLLT
jgi:hypothetical protein